jgi:hypothetical protein
MFELLLIITNGCIFPTIAYLLKNYKKYYTEIFTFTSLLFFSSFYHYCLLFGCTIYPILYKWDRIFALQSVTTSMTNIIDDRLYVRKICWLMNFVSNIITMYIDGNSINTILTSSVFFNMMFIVNCHKIYNWEYLKIFLSKLNILNLISTILFIIVGLMFFHYTKESNYVYYHSVWHICIFLSTFTSLFIKKKNVYVIVKDISMDNFANYPRTP